jgi:UDP-3-O-[3-hydroxymyristoyl] glucosamine N-acyltransferase
MDTESMLAHGWQPNGSFISKTAKVSTLASIAPMVVVGPGTIIQPDAVIQRCVTIGAGVRVEKGCIIRPGATIGCRVQLGRDVCVGAFCVLGSDFLLERNTRIPDFATLSGKPEAYAEDESESVEPIMTNVNAGAQLSKNVVLGLGARVGRAVLANGVVIGYGGKISDDSQLGAFAAVGFDAEVFGVSMGKRAQLGAAGRLVNKGLADHEALLSAPFEHALLN